MLIEQILNGFKLIGAAFFKEPSIWWFLIPVFLLWIGMEVYFGQYKKERLGWNSILANGISFSWINIAGFRVLFMEDLEAISFSPRFILLLLFFLYGMFIIYIAFFHRLSPKMAANLAAPTPIYFLSVVSILWGQGILIINYWIFLDLLIAYIVISLLFWLIRHNLGILGEVEAIKKGERPV
jgi:hypothetical protein